MSTQTTTDGQLDQLSPEMLASFFAEAAVAVGTLAEATTRTVDCFRRNDPKAGHDLLMTLPLELREFIVMMSVVTGPLGIDRAQLVIDDLPPDAQIVRLGGWLESLVAAQTNDDPLTIADILEYDLEPFLRSWQSLLTRQAGG